MGFRECCQVIWLYAGVEAFREWNDQRNGQGLCRVQHVSRYQGNQSTVCSIHGLQTACPVSEGGAGCGIRGMRRQGAMSGLGVFPLSLAWCLGEA